MRFGTVLFSLALATVATGAAEAQVQRKTWGGAWDHRFELGAHGGYVWTFSREVLYLATGGDVDVKDSGFFGFTADFVVRPDAQLELLYNRQSSTLTFQQFGSPVKSDVGDLSVEYFHIGGLGGRRQGKAFPFGSFTLGATRYATNLAGVDDVWRFSIIPGLGVKFYPGGRFSLRLQGRLPLSITDGGYGFACGGGGCYTSVGGTGNAQIDVGGGVAILF